jgi:hypothetical protein
MPLLPSRFDAGAPIGDADGERRLSTQRKTGGPIDRVEQRLVVYGLAQEHLRTEVAHHRPGHFVVTSRDDDDGKAVAELSEPRKNVVSGNAGHGQVEQDAALFSVDQIIEEAFRRSIRASIDADRPYQPGKAEAHVIVIVDDVDGQASVVNLAHAEIPRYFFQDLSGLLADAIAPV